MAEHRRILLDGAVTPVVVEGDELVAGDGRRVAAERRRPPSAVRARRRSSASTSTTSRGCTSSRSKLPPAPTYFHKPTSSLNVASRSTSCDPNAVKWLNYEGEVVIVIGRAVPQRVARRGGRLHRRLHDRQRLRPARLPRHRRRVDAAGEGQRHAVPRRARAS